MFDFKIIDNYFDTIDYTKINLINQY